MSTLRIAGTAAAIVGAAVSITLLLLAGKSSPTLLLIMFIGWVLLPFVALAAGVLSSRLSEQHRTTFSITSIVVAIASISVYTFFTYSPLTTTPARVWLLVPSSSLIIIAAAFVYIRLRR